MTRAEYQREWRKRNPGKTAEYSRRYRERHPETYKSYAELNGERLRAKQRAKYRDNREAVMERNRKWQESNPEWRKAYFRAYYERHRAKIKADAAAYRKAHPEVSAEYQRRRRARAAGVGIERIDKAIVFARDGWRCQICGAPTLRKWKNHPRAPELDHRVPISRGGGHTYENVQLACRRCNMDKKNLSCAGQLPLWHKPLAPPSGEED